MPVLTSFIPVVPFALMLMFILIFSSKIHETGHKRAILKSYKKYGNVEPYIKIKLGKRPFTFSPFFSFLQINENNPIIQEDIRKIAISGFARTFCISIVLDILLYGILVSLYVFLKLPFSNCVLIFMLITFLAAPILLFLCFIAGSDYYFYKQPNKFVYNPQDHYDKDFDAKNTTNSQSSQTWKV